MKEPSRLHKFLGAFNTRPGGDSARKLSACLAVWICAALSLWLTTEAVLVEVIMVWLAFAGLCLGLVTMEQLITFRTGDTKKTTTVETPDKPIE